ncbi:MAG: IclR family transcriptional regulator [Acetobacteraceae bacterium]
METSKTVANALRFLECLTREDPVLTIAALTRHLGLPRTNVLRLASTLEAFRLIEREPGGGYRVGIRAFELGSLYLMSNPVSELVGKALDDLVVATQCTAYLGILEKDEAVILMCREGSLPVRFVWQAGARLPSTTTALGKAILMHLPPAELETQLGGHKPLRTLTPHSLHSYKDLERDLRAARRRGWSLAREESHAGLTAVGAAIIDSSDHAIAGISLSYLDHPPDAARREQLAALIRETAGRVSARLCEYRPYGGAHLP